MSEYPNISKFASELLNGNSGVFEEYCKLSDLEAILAKGVVVYGQNDSMPYNMSHVYDNRSDTHSGLLLSYQPIESSEPVKVEEIDDLLGWYGNGHGPLELKQTVDLLKRIKRNGMGK